ncbi:hypothetical protein [Flavobacterium chilense]|uniref:Uncharacterized protein n=1 Tax=Flavobacterium chilense TaxID=946677 RepID=A0A1M7DWC6_9FLAO|nr:hypothetical protein [Flavobacterium chilense]SHL83750.1 hypothetical protein SAMN05444484_102753 [Flavobacterium chilense]
MKKLPIITAFLLLLVFWNNSIFAQIGMTGNNPSPSAVLDLREGATQKGLLIPQVSLSDITTGSPIVTGSPATSLLVYNTNASVTGGSGTGYYYWDGAKWQRLVAGTTGTKADNLGNHTAIQTLNMANNNINNANKLATTTSSIAKGIDGNAAQAGSLLTAGDTSGNANWVMPAFQRTFFWKAAKGTLSVNLGTSAPYSYFDGMSYTAPANGTLDVSMIIFGGYFMANPVNNYQYGNISITLQPLENGAPIAGSAVTTAASPAAIGVSGSGTVVGMRECLWLGTRFRVIKGATYTFQITGKNDAGYPADPAAYQATFGSASTLSPPAGSDGRAYPSLSGVFHVDGSEIIYLND